MEAKEKASGKRDTAFILDIYVDYYYLIEKIDRINHIFSLY